MAAYSLQFGLVDLISTTQKHKCRAWACRTSCYPQMPGQSLPQPLLHSHTTPQALMVNLFNIMHVLYWNQHGYTLSSNLSLLSGSHFDVNHIKSKARYVLCENGRTVLDSNVKAPLGAAEYWHDAVCCLVPPYVRDADIGGALCYARSFSKTREISHLRE